MVKDARERVGLLHLTPLGERGANRRDLSCQFSDFQSCVHLSVLPQGAMDGSSVS